MKPNPWSKSSHGLNHESIKEVQTKGNDANALRPHTVNVDNETEPDWYLQEWAKVADKRQADLVNDLGWLKNHAYRIWHGKQPYRRDIVNTVAAWLGIEPYELLMPPQEALQIRQLREAALAIAAHQSPNRGK